MSGISIRSGAVVEVDTESLRRVAVTLSARVREVSDLLPRVAAVSELAIELAAHATPPTAVAAFEANLLRSALEGAVREGEELVEKLRSAAALYEAVELYVERDAAAAAGDASRLDHIDRRLGRLSAQDPRAVLAGRLALDGARSGHGDLYAQSFLGLHFLGPASPWLAVPLVFGLADLLRLGPIPAGARLTGAEAPVRVRPVASGPGAAPAGLAAAAERIPSGDGAQLRVERYAMPDGTRQFAVYVTGTRSGGGGEQPFDMRSNLSLYSGERSASYAAVTAALRDAGARQGDAVHAFGHSQGAMVLERLALEGHYDTRTLVSFGSPVQADVGSQTLSVSVRHTDDPVAALQSGGHATGVGAPGSFVVERLGDPAPGLHDLTLPSHHLWVYVETAAMVDASADPRVEGVRDVFAHLSEAESVESTDYEAERVSRGDEGGGRGRRSS